MYILFTVKQLIAIFGNKYLNTICNDA